MPYPRQSQTVHAERLGEELCLYDWRRQRVHALNRTAAFVWERCDGRTSPEHMAAELRRTMKVVEPEGLVDLALRRLARARLLTEGSSLAPGGRLGIGRRELLKRGVAAALLPVVYSLAARPASAQVVSTGSETFTFTGAQQDFTVPAGVTSVTVEAAGAQGGSGLPVNGSVPGNGGTVTATIAVTPGETLAVFVGGQGSTGSGTTGGAGGFNGGAAGGEAGAPGGGGGGASDVRQGGTGLANRVVVGGGGGGGGATDLGSASGGAGGGLTGAPGDTVAGVAAGGGGGTQVAGGAGGTGGPGNDGDAGALGTGGDGGGTGTAFGGGGGGGGGGYYGGGGGESGPFDPAGGGGGGGSSFTDPGATGVSHLQGNRAGNGQVIISW